MVNKFYNFFNAGKHPIRFALLYSVWLSFCNYVALTYL